MPNSFALLVLVAWPAAAYLLFRSLPIGRALIATLLVAYLFLPPPPAGFDFPLMPPLTKDTIPSLCAIFLCLVFARDGVRFLPENPAARMLLAAFVLSPYLTILTNAEPVFYGRIGLPGLRLREAVALTVQQSMLVAPMLLARQFLSTARDQRDIVLALFLGGLVYSLPMLLEVRLSPQLNIWIYGYFQHSFEQMMRDGGFRPIVFLYHGLWVAFFAMTAVVAATILARTETGPRRFVYIIAALYLVVVLVLCKSLGSLLFAIFLVPLVLVLGRRMQLHIATLLVILAIGYPVLKGAGLVPVDRMVALAAEASAERANSLDFRFNQENILMERASEKPLFGWGIWGRNHILDENDGHILTVTDGRWIIVIGVFGWVGFIAEFGLLALPVLLMWRKGALRDPSGLSPIVPSLALLLGVNMIDLIPNATITPITWLIAGSILGYAEAFSPQRRDNPGTVAAARRNRPADLKTVL